MPEVKDIPGYELDDAGIAGTVRRVHELSVQMGLKTARGEDTSELKAARIREIEALDKLECDELFARGRFYPRCRAAPWRD